MPQSDSFRGCALLLARPTFFQCQKMPAKQSNRNDRVEHSSGPQEHAAKHGGSTYPREQARDTDIVSKKALDGALRDPATREGRHAIPRARSAIPAKRPRSRPIPSGVAASRSRHGTSSTVMKAAPWTIPKSHADVVTADFCSIDFSPQFRPELGTDSSSSNTRNVV